MRKKFNFLKSRYRKIIHFSLILCLIFIQVLIAGYFYNEFASREKLESIEKKLSSLNTLEQLAEDSKNHLLGAQNHLQNYVLTKDKTELEDYFASLNGIAENLNLLENKKGNLKVDANLRDIGMENPAAHYKKLLDSTFTVQIDQKPPVAASQKIEFPQLHKFDAPDLNFESYDVETKVFTDTVKKKKNLFGRIGDAIKGKEITKKDSTVVIMKPGAKPNSEKLKLRFDSVVNALDKHYSREITKIERTVVKQQPVEKDNSGFYKVFGSLIDYSNRLIGVYGNAVKSSKAELMAEYNLQNSKSSKVRKNIVLAALILMFILSALILLLTRLAFLYEQKLNQANKQIKENLNFKNRVLGMLSHELRAPLKIVDLFIKRINKKTDSEEIKEYLKSISFTNNSLLIQAEQILEYTKNQQIENKLSPVHFNLNSEIESILTAMQPYVEARHNQFIIERSIDPSIDVFSDKAKIHQLYLNIIGNANKFTENGTIIVKATAHPAVDGVIPFETTVQDTGAGILKSDLEKIFEPYFQGALSGDIENIGAGLGLNLSKEIVHLYSGNISVESEVNKGTTVFFSINLKQDNGSNHI